MKVALTYNKDLHFKASVRNFKDFNVDEPDSFHGTNLGPSAVEYLLVGIGGCLGTTFIYCLQKMNIELNECNVVVDGKLSHIGPKKRLKLVNVDVEMNFSVKETTTKESINKCVKDFKENCIVTSSIADGLPITVNCNQI
ncbi:MAG: OsmC family peroxiredoxin [Promethearchaeota archaeon]|nr:MAG: OsmC family peroxiredoxin [Candidatus Lokiarchaeota archaeon]